MPRAEGIAWKFVIRQGKKWRCPYCKKEYSGSVTRVKSHFCKQPKEGIVSCTKVDNKDDIAWKFVDRLGENIWHCHHCKEVFLGDLAGGVGVVVGPAVAENRAGFIVLATVLMGALVLWKMRLITQLITG
ncbi:hypothetical protein ACJRO7_022955 [Eucalyptus globulus]|uniref:BED-type domain-containing protein n=1 Tax=Eucalyptus globulus TaxID=34317 RepID=A0ABD3K062_EUCGL